MPLAVEDDDRFFGRKIDLHIFYTRRGFQRGLDPRLAADRSGHARNGEREARQAGHRRCVGPRCGRFWRGTLLPASQDDGTRSEQKYDIPKR